MGSKVISETGTEDNYSVTINEGNNTIYGGGAGAGLRDNEDLHADNQSGWAEHF